VRRRPWLSARRGAGHSGGIVSAVAALPEIEQFSPAT
jgi:hypothetical protein